MILNPVWRFPSLTEVTVHFLTTQEVMFGSLTGEQKVERILTPGLVEDESVVRELFGSVVKSSDQNQLDEFFEKLISMSAQVGMSCADFGVHVMFSCLFVCFFLPNK